LPSFSLTPGVTGAKVGVDLNNRLLFDAKDLFSDSQCQSRIHKELSCRIPSDELYSNTVTEIGRRSIELLLSRVVTVAYHLLSWHSTALTYRHKNISNHGTKVHDGRTKGNKGWVIISVVFTTFFPPRKVTVKMKAKVTIPKMKPIKNRGRQEIEDYFSAWTERLFLPRETPSKSDEPEDTSLYLMW
jgi:hypothetical protein